MFNFWETSMRSHFGSQPGQTKQVSKLYLVTVNNYGKIYITYLLNIGCAHDKNNYLNRVSRVIPNI